VRVRVPIGEAPDRGLALSPLWQLDPQRTVEAADIRTGRRAAHAARSASTSALSAVPPTSMRAVDLHRNRLTRPVSARS
jgi:hypothetical protein